MRPNGAKDEFLLGVTAQNLRKLVKLIPMPSTPLPVWAGSPQLRRLKPNAKLPPNRDFFNTIGT